MTWQHIVIENAYNEQRFLIRSEWAGDTYFYFDVAGLAYEKYPTQVNSPETFEQVSSGDRWSMCEGYYVNYSESEVRQ